MRQITIDFSADQSGMISAFGGYDGEHNETKLTAVLPDRLFNGGAVDFRFIFQTSNGEEIYSDPVETDDPLGNTVSVMLHQQLTTAPELRFCVAAYRYEGEDHQSPVLVAKTATARLSILYPSTGEPTPPFLDPLPVPQSIKVRTSEEGIRDFDEAEDNYVPSEKAVANEFINFPQGHSVKYRVGTSGWKRLLVTIRSLGGVLQLSLGKRGFGNVYQSVGVVFTGYVEFAEQKEGCKPTLYQIYNNEFGDAEPSGRSRITKVRIGYPKPGTEFPIPNKNGVLENPENPINCYVDVYFEIDKNVEDHFVVKGENPPTQFGFDFFGRVLNHNCEIIPEETDVTDSNVGMYGEELNFCELELNPNLDIHNANLPLGDFNTAGLLRLDGAAGTYDRGVRPAAGPNGTTIPGTIAIARATNTDIDARKSLYKPIVPSTLEYAVKSVGDGYYAKEEVLGDVESALDAIIDIQNSLIGGDSE